MAADRPELTLSVVMVPVLPKPVMSANGVTVVVLSLADRERGNRRS